MDSLKIAFTHSNTVRDKKPYTIYEIELRSSSTITWVIYKRFSHFDALHQSLLKSSQLSHHTRHHKLPVLPPKRLTRSLAAEFVEKRKQELEAYLCAVVEIPELLHHPLVVQFLEVPDSVKPMLLGSIHHSNSNAASTHQHHSSHLQSSTDEQQRTINNPATSTYTHQKYGSGYNTATYEERYIYELCYELQVNHNKVAAMKSFEDYLTGNRPKFSTEGIRKLLTGSTTGDASDVADEYSRSGIQQSTKQASPTSTQHNNNNYATSYDDSINSRTDLTSQHHRQPTAAPGQQHTSKRPVGLIQVSGDLHYSHVASRAALLFLCRLLDVEKNKDANQYLDIFCALDVSTLRQLSLAEHILSDRGDRHAAFVIAQILQKSEAQRESQHQQDEKTQSYSKHPTMLEYIVNNNEALAEYNQWAEHTSTTASDSAATASSGVPIDTSLKALPLDIASGSYKQIAQQCFSSLLSVYNDNTGFRVVTPVGSLPKMTDINEQVKLSYKKDYQKDMIVVKCNVIIPYSVAAVTAIISNVRRRKEWDCKFHSGHLLQAIDAQHDIIHLVFKSFSSPYKYRDFVVLQAYSETEDGGYVQACRSVLHNSAPEGKEHVRAVLYPTGYIITPLQNQPVNVHTTTSKSGQQQPPPHPINTKQDSHADEKKAPSPVNQTNTGIKKISPAGNTARQSRGRPPSPMIPSSTHASPAQNATSYSPQYTHVKATSQANKLPLNNLPPVVQTLNNEACMLTFVAQMDKESILIVSPDLLGETNELRYNMNNLKGICAREYGLRTLQPSQHTANLMSPNNLHPLSQHTSQLASQNQRDEAQKVIQHAPTQTPKPIYSQPLQFDPSMLQSLYS